MYVVSLIKITNNIRYIFISWTHFVKILGPPLMFTFYDSWTCLQLMSSTCKSQDFFAYFMILIYNLYLLLVKVFINLNFHSWESYFFNSIWFSSMRSSTTRGSNHNSWNVFVNSKNLLTSSYFSYKAFESYFHAKYLQTTSDLLKTQKNLHQF